MAREHVVTIPPNQVLRVGRRDFPRLAFYFSGGVEIECPDGSLRAIEAGDGIAFPINSHCRYRSISHKNPVELAVLIIEFIPGFLSSRAARQSEPSASFSRIFDSDSTGIRYFPGGFDCAGGRELLPILRREAEKQKSASTITVSGLVMALLSNLLNAGKRDLQASTPTASSGEMAAKHACQFIREHYHENLTLQGIAWKIHRSGEHLERLFKRHVGCSVFTYINRIRLERVKEKLLQTDLPVNEIAVRCGYSSPTLLGRHFKASTGVTPLTFRRQFWEHEKFSPSSLQAEPGSNATK